MPSRKKAPFLLISGPCVLEDTASALKIARKLKKLTEKLGWDFVFKASFDKANRTSIESARGIGLDAGLEILADIKKRLQIPVTTDIHEAHQIEPASKVIDILQIPAFLCRQTDLIVAAGKSGCAVNVKKGQFLAPDGADAIAEKLKSVGCKKYWITERGTSFGYHNLVVDMRGLVWMREKGHPVIFDATHSVQRPGGLGKTTGGDGNLAAPLARAAVAIGINGLFIETHPDPATSPSDGPNMIPLAQMPKVLQQIEAVRLAANT